MEKNNQNLKFKLLAVFALSNLSSLMLGSSFSAPVEMPIEKAVQIEKRPNYLTMKLKVETKASLNFTDPFVITNSRQTLYIPFVFFKGKVEVESPEFSDLTGGKSREQIEFSVPRKFVSKLIREKDLVIIPQVGREHLKSKHAGRNYEINY